MTILSRATLPGGSIIDVRIVRGTIIAIGPGGTLDASRDEKAIDLTGYLLVPSPVEPHTHLDKAFSTVNMKSLPGDLPGAIAAYMELGRERETPEILRCAQRAVAQSVAFGATAIRTHVDVDEDVELRGLEAIMTLRQQLAGSIPIQIVALVSSPTTGRAGANNQAILRAALERGADFLGGSPHTDSSPKVALELAMMTAAEFGKPVDLHMDETLDESMLGLADLATIARDFPHSVTASHCVSLGIQRFPAQRQVAEALAAAGVSVVTLPQTNLYLQGRGWETSPPRALTAVRTLIDAGVSVGAGADNVQDVFNPIGCGDPIEAARLLIMAGHLEPENAYELVSDGARGAMGMPATGVQVGDRADLLAIAASSLRESLGSRTEGRIVFAGGSLVARTRVTRTMFVRPLESARQH